MPTIQTLKSNKTKVSSYDFFFLENPNIGRFALAVRDFYNFRNFVFFPHAPPDCPINLLNPAFHAERLRFERVTIPHRFRIARPPGFFLPPFRYHTRALRAAPGNPNRRIAALFPRKPYLLFFFEKFIFPKNKKKERAEIREINNWQAGLSYTPRRKIYAFHG